MKPATWSLDGSCAFGACEYASGEAPDASEGELPPDLMRSALQYVDDNLDSKLSWAQIAAAVGLSAFRFGRAFKLASGVTPRQYVIRCRVARAMKLLQRAEPSIAEIALEVGCSCQSHLTTVFRKHTGTTPGAFRRAARENGPQLDLTAMQAAARGSVREPVTGATERPPALARGGFAQRSTTWNVRVSMSGDHPARHRTSPLVPLASLQES